MPFGKDYEMVSQAVFIEDGTLMIPIRDSMEMFGLDVKWYQDELCAEVNIPEEIGIPEGLAIIPNHGNGKWTGHRPPPQKDYYAVMPSFLQSQTAVY